MIVYIENLKLEDSSVFYIDFKSSKLLCQTKAGAPTKVAKIMDLDGPGEWINAGFFLTNSNFPDSNGCGDPNWNLSPVSDTEEEG